MGDRAELCYHMVPHAGRLRVIRDELKSCHWMLTLLRRQPDTSFHDHGPLLREAEHLIRHAIGRLADAQEECRAEGMPMAYEEDEAG
jgi:hypothetical protein